MEKAGVRCWCVVIVVKSGCYKMWLQLLFRHVAGLGEF